MAKKFDTLRSKMSSTRQAAVRQRVDALLAEMPLQELRQARNLSQATIAALLDTNQASISKLEHRVDVYVSTLRSYIQAMGGELDIVARFPDGSVRINQFEDLGPVQLAPDRELAPA
ncbi:MAG: XRE family transcriptional regulator [Gemmatimonadaceae bacterium]